MKFDQAYNVMKNGGRIRRTTWYPTMYWYMDKNGKIKQNNNGMGGEMKCQLKMYLQMIGVK